MIEFIGITDRAEVAYRWDLAGVDRIMVDLETYGKAHRQAGRDTVRSNHSLTAVTAIRAAVPTAHTVVRCEPLRLPSWSDHLAAVLEQKPTSVMLPMAETVDDVKTFADAVAGRCSMIVMIETKRALAQVDDLIAAAPNATYFVGLNDLHIQLEDAFMFEPLANGHVDAVAAAAHRHGARFGFGGLARPGSGLVDAIDVVKEHVRLGSSLAILARSFFSQLDDTEDPDQIAIEIDRLRNAEVQAARRTARERADDSRRVRAAIRAVASGARRTS